MFGMQIIPSGKNYVPGHIDIDTQTNHFVMKKHTYKKALYRLTRAAAIPLSLCTPEMKQGQRGESGPFSQVFKGFKGRCPIFAVPIQVLMPYLTLVFFSLS